MKRFLNIAEDTFFSGNGIFIFSATAFFVFYAASAGTVNGLCGEFSAKTESEKEDEGLSPAVASGFEAEYDKILKKAEEEYENEPPSDYYREGYNLFVRLREYKENELLFLHDKRVPANNSLCERRPPWKKKEADAKV